MPDDGRPIIRVSKGTAVAALFLLFLGSVLWKLDVDKKQDAGIETITHRTADDLAAAVRERNAKIAALEARVAVLEARMPAPCPTPGVR